MDLTGRENFDVLNDQDHRANCDDPDATATVFDKLHSTWVLVFDGRWIIKGVKGEFYPCADDVFRETYEPATAERDHQAEQDHDDPYDGLGPYGIAVTALERILELDSSWMSWDEARAIASEAHGLAVAKAAAGKPETMALSAARAHLGWIWRETTDENARQRADLALIALKEAGIE